MTGGWISDLLDEALGGSRSTSTQLQLSLGAWARQPHVVSLGPEAPGRLEVELTPRGASVELDLPEMDGLRSWAGPPLIHGMNAWETERFPTSRCVFHAEFRVTRPVRVVVQTLEVSNRLVMPDLHGGVARTTRALLRFLADVQWAHARQVHRDSLVAAARLMTTTLRHLESLCCRQVRRVARRFPDGATGWFVYEAVANDPTGRVLQMVEVCPGLLVLASGLRDMGRHQGCADILAAIEGGWKLGKILDLAVEAWWQGLLRTGRPGQGSARPGAERRRQRLRVRHAGVRVHPAALMHPSLPGICREDIPHGPRQNALWYEATSQAVFRDQEGEMHAGEGAAGRWPLRVPVPNIRLEGLSPEQLRGLGGFLSRHWLAERLQDPDSGRLDPRAVGELADFLRETGRSPGRQTDPNRLLEECDDWHAHAAWWSHARLPPDTPLRTEGLDEWIAPGARVTPLRTVAELIHESETMYHCVASHAHLGATGEAQFFHACIHGNPVTVMTTQRNRPMQIVEARGQGNRPTTPEEDAVLSAWLEEMQSRANKRSA